MDKTDGMTNFYKKLYQFGVQEFIRFYSYAYKIAKENINADSVVPYRQILREYRTYLREKVLVKQVIG